MDSLAWGCVMFVGFGTTSTCLPADALLNQPTHEPDNLQSSHQTPNHPTVQQLTIKPKQKFGPKPAALNSTGPMHGALRAKKKRGVLGGSIHGGIARGATYEHARTQAQRDIPVSTSPRRTFSPFSLGMYLPLPLVPPPVS